MIRWRGEPDPRARRGRRRLLGLRRRARHERLDVHRPGHRLHRRRRRRLPLRARSARCPGRCTAARPSRVLHMLDGVEETGDARRYVKGVLDRGERLMGFGHRVYRAEDPRARVLRRTARASSAPRATRPPPRWRRPRSAELRAPPARPGARDQRRVLGRRRPRLRRGPAAHVHADVHLRPHRRLVGAHPRAEAHRAADPAVAPATSARGRASRGRRRLDSGHRLADCAVPRPAPDRSSGADAGQARRQRIASAAHRPPPVTLT